MNNRHSQLLSLSNVGNVGNAGGARLDRDSELEPRTPRNRFETAVVKACITKRKKNVMPETKTIPRISRLMISTNTANNRKNYKCKVRECYKWIQMSHTVALIVKLM